MTTPSRGFSLRATLLSVNVGRGLLARFLFTAHATLCVYEVVLLVDNPSIWFILFLLGVLYMEFFFVIFCRKGTEWKWFFGCVLCYLMVVVPTLWILELDILSKRLEARSNDDDHCGMLDLPTNRNNTIEFLAFLGLDGTGENWSLILQQLLIFVLIIGRWILPRGTITGGQLSQLLLVYVGSGADILEFSSEGLRLEEIQCDSTVIYAILGIWTCSLLQFTLPLTVTGVSRPNVIAKGIARIRYVVTTCCATEIWAILVTVLTQDGPFLVVRLYLMIHKHVINELLLFFACKNILAILLQGNRLRALLKERRRRRMSLRSRVAFRWAGAARNILDRNSRNIESKAVERDVTAHRNSNALENDEEAARNIGDHQNSRNIESKDVERDITAHRNSNVLENEEEAARNIVHQDSWNIESEDVGRHVTVHRNSNVLENEEEAARNIEDQNSENIESNDVERDITAHRNSNVLENEEEADRNIVDQDSWNIVSEDVERNVIAHRNSIVLENEKEAARNIGDQTPMNIESNDVEKDVTAHRNSNVLENEEEFARNTGDQNSGNIESEDLERNGTAHRDSNNVHENE